MRVDKGQCPCQFMIVRDRSVVSFCGTSCKWNECTVVNVVSKMAVNIWTRYNVREGKR